MLLCAGVFSDKVKASSDDWVLVESYFTETNVAEFIKDPAFAKVVYDDIKDAIIYDYYWMEYDSEYLSTDFPQTKTVEQIANDTSLTTDLDKVKALLINYTSSIYASNEGITDISGWQYLANADSVDLSNNNITDVSSFTGTTIRAAYDFSGNQIGSWPSTLPNIVGDGEHIFNDKYSVNKPIVEIKYGNTASATVNFNVKIDNEDNKDWANSTVEHSVPVYTQTPEGTVATWVWEDLEGFEMDGNSSITYSGVTQETEYRASGSISIPYSNGSCDPDSREEIESAMTYTFETRFDFMATLKFYDETTSHGGFVFTKTSEASGKPVPGTQYKLCNADGTDYSTTIYTTDAKGQFSESGLPAGNYQLIEVKPASGYALNPDPIKVVINEPALLLEADGGSLADFPTIGIDPVNQTLTAVWASSANSYEKETEPVYLQPDDGIFVQNRINKFYSALTSVAARLNDPAFTAAGAEEVIVKIGDTQQTITGGSDATEAANKIVRDYLNTLIYDNLLTNNITITLYGSYIQKDNYYTKVYGTDAPLPVNLTISAKSILNGGTVNATGKRSFQLNISGTADAGGAEINQTLSVTPDAVQTADDSGTALFDMLTFDKVGTYTYTISEIIPAEGDDAYDATVNYNPNGTQHIVVVTVTEEEATGGLTATVTIDNNLLDETFTGFSTNQRAADFAATADPGNIDAGSIINRLNLPIPVTIDVTGAKTLEGGDLTTADIEADQFSFTVTRTSSENGLVTGLPEASVSAEAGTGKLDFGAWTFEAAGTYTFTINENDVIGNYVKAKDVLMVVEVTFNEDTNKLEAAESYSGGSTTGLNFTNTYIPTATGSNPGSETSYTVPAVTKAMAGDSVPSGLMREFTITITAVSTDIAGMDVTDIPLPGNTSITRTVTGNGTAAPEVSGDDAFGTIKYTLAGTYVYTIAETANNGKGFTCDTTVYTLTVTVTANDSGISSSGVIARGSEAFAFTNRYTASTKAPSTGDSSSIALWIMLITLSGAGIVCLTVFSNSKKKRWN